MNNRLSVLNKRNSNLSKAPIQAKTKQRERNSEILKMVRRSLDKKILKKINIEAKPFWIRGKYSRLRRRSGKRESLNTSLRSKNQENHLKPAHTSLRQKPKVLKRRSAIGRLHVILNKEAQSNGLISKFRNSLTRKENDHINLSKWIGGDKQHKTYDRTRKVKHCSKREQSFEDSSSKKGINYKRGSVFSKILGFQKRSRSQDVGSRPKTSRQNQLKKLTTETTNVSNFLQTNQNKEEKQKRNFKLLEDFLISMSPHVRLFRLRYMSDCYDDLGQLGAGKTATVRKIQRKSDSKCFTGKFLDLEKLISNGFFRRLKVTIY